MGISGLWKTIAPAGEPKSLFVYSTKLKARLRAGGSNHTIYFGVDMRPLMAECTAAASATTVNGRWAGDELYILFNKLSGYLKCPVTFVFVFDGPGRPEIKRGHQVIHKEPRWTRLSQELIKLFGYYSHQAPGEAEAELANMNRLGLIDAVLTSDGDAFVFGAETVLRMRILRIPNTQKQYDDEVHLYTKQNLEALGLTQAGFILYALISGGDYDTGIKDCGSAGACALAQCAFGSELVEAVQTLTEKDLHKFLIGWRDSLRNKLKTNSQGKLRQSRPHAASQIPETFPNLSILGLYMTPLTSWSDSNISAPSSITWIQREPDLLNLTRFASAHFDWKTEGELKSKFSSLVWEGAILQATYSKHVLYDHTRMYFTTPYMSFEIRSINFKARKGKYAAMVGPEPQPRLLISASNLVDLMGPAFSPDPDATVAVWAHGPLLPPQLQVDVRHKKTRKRKSRSTYHLPPHHQESDLIDLTVAGGSDGEEIGAGSTSQVHHLGYISLTSSSGSEREEADKLEIIDLTQLSD